MNEIRLYIIGLVWFSLFALCMLHSLFWMPFVIFLVPSILKIQRDEKKDSRNYKIKEILK